MQLSQKNNGIIMIVFLLAGMIYVSATRPFFDDVAILCYGIACFIVVMVVTRVALEPMPPFSVQHQLEAFLQTLNEAELKVLRHRVMTYPTEEYTHESRSLREIITIGAMIGLLGLLSAAGFAFRLNALLLSVCFAVALFASVTLINWAAAIEKNAHHKVEKLLHRLNDTDRELLRSHLAHNKPDEEYGSMAELVQSDKRKNEER